MLIYHGRRLRAAVAIRDLEIEGGNAMFAEGTLECGAAVHRLGCVVSHLSSVVLSSAPGPGQKVCNLRAGNSVAGVECAVSMITHLPVNRALLWTRLMVPGTG